VLYQGDRLLPGAREFVWWLHASGRKFLFLTNASDRTPAEMVAKFHRLGLDFVHESHFLTSAMTTASFLFAEKGPGSRAYVIGERALRDALTEKGILVVNEASAEMSNPDFVVCGESSSAQVYNFEKIANAIKFVRRGARLIGTNEDLADRVGAELHPGTGALMLPIVAVSGVTPLFMGKPSPLTAFSALERLGANRESTFMVGDRTSTDVLLGVQAQLTTVLVLSGVTSEADIARYSFRPSLVLNGVGDIPAILGETVEVPDDTSSVVPSKL